MKNKIFTTIALSILLFIAATPFISAHCPVCTAGAVAGIGIARTLGVDDSIVGLFIGALIISSALWFNKWLNKRKIKIPLQETLIVLLSFALMVIPLYIAGVITNFDMVKSMPEHHAMLGLGIFGIDKLFSGILFGSAFVWLAFSFSDYIKKKRGKVLYPYQGISFMFIVLGVLSLIFWLVTK